MNGSESQGKLDLSKPITKVKNYQVTTISMSRKNSVKSMETSNHRGSLKNKILQKERANYAVFKSFLRQPTNVSK